MERTERGKHKNKLGTTVMCWYLHPFFCSEVRHLDSWGITIRRLVFRVVFSSRSCLFSSNAVTIFSKSMGLPRALSNNTSERDRDTVAPGHNLTQRIVKCRYTASNDLIVRGFKTFHLVGQDDPHQLPRAFANLERGRVRGIDN